MDFAIFNDYFVLVVVAACLALGYIIKHSTLFKWIPNDDIPAILAVVGAILNVIDSGFSLETIVFGAIMGLSSTGCHQYFKAWVEGKNSQTA